MIGTERVLAAVAARTGGLRVDEHACVYGAALAQLYTPVPTSEAARQADAVAQAVVAFRSMSCRLCDQELGGHALDLTPTGADVRCLASQAATPVNTWLGVRSDRRAGGAVLAGLCWIGIPLLSAGLASWLMPAIAAGRYRRPSWALAATIFASLAVLALVVTPTDPAASSTAATAASITAWVGGGLYGAFQMRPWLDARGRAHGVDVGRW